MSEGWSACAKSTVITFLRCGRKGVDGWQYEDLSPSTGGSVQNATLKSEKIKLFLIRNVLQRTTVMP